LMCFDWALQLQWQKVFIGFATSVAKKYGSLLFSFATKVAKPKILQLKLQSPKYVCN
jgi:hypothetical protein